MKGYSYLLSQPSGTQNQATLAEGEFLYSDRTGIEANPNPVSGYRTFAANANKLVSINNKFILILEMNGNLTVRAGNFNQVGNLILPDGRVLVAPNDLPEIGVLWSLAKSNIIKDNAGFGFTNGPFGLGLNNKEIVLVSLKTQKTIATLAKFNPGGTKFLFIENSGDLVVTANGKNIWRLSKGNIDENVDPLNPNPDTIPTGPGTATNQTFPAPTTNSGSPILYLIGAGLAAYFFFFKNAK